MMSGNTYLGGGMNVAGSKVPAAVLHDVVAHMRSQAFTSAQLQEVALASLRVHGGPITTCMVVGERMLEKHRRSGLIHRVVPGRVPVWAWVG